MHVKIQAASANLQNKLTSNSLRLLTVLFNVGTAERFFQFPTCSNAAFDSDIVGAEIAVHSRQTKHKLILTVELLTQKQLTKISALLSLNHHFNLEMHTRLPI